jgi:hypothetical protein
MLEGRCVLLPRLTSGVRSTGKSRWRVRSAIAVGAALAAGIAMLAAQPASAELSGVGPVDAVGHGYPLWYEDANGLRLTWKPTRVKRARLRLNGLGVARNPARHPMSRLRSSGPGEWSRPSGHGDGRGRQCAARLERPDIAGNRTVARTAIQVIRSAEWFG